MPKLVKRIVAGDKDRWSTEYLCDNKLVKVSQISYSDDYRYYIEKWFDRNGAMFCKEMEHWSYETDDRIVMWFSGGGDCYKTERLPSKRLKNLMRTLVT